MCMLTRLFFGSHKCRKRAEAFRKAKSLFEGKQYNEARNLLRQCISRSSLIQVTLTEALRQQHIEWIIAPQEADAELALLSKLNLIDAVMSCDTDFVALGVDLVCACVLSPTSSCVIDLTVPRFAYRSYTR